MHQQSQLLLLQYLVDKLFVNILSSATQSATQHLNSLSYVFRQSFSEERPVAMTKISQRQLLF